MLGSNAIRRASRQKSSYKNIEYKSHQQQSLRPLSWQASRQEFSHPKEMRDHQPGTLWASQHRSDEKKSSLSKEVCSKLIEGA